MRRKAFERRVHRMHHLSAADTSSSEDEDGDDDEDDDDDGNHFDDDNAGLRAHRRRLSDEERLMRQWLHASVVPFSFITVNRINEEDEGSLSGGIYN